MKLHPVLTVILAAGLLVANPVAGAEKKAGPRVPRPVVKVDGTPVGDGRGVVVTSYADVIEPVQKAVVSIYSSKVVRERMEMNPLFRQLFPNLPDQERQSVQEGLGSGVIVSPDG